MASATHLLGRVVVILFIISVPLSYFNIHLYVRDRCLPVLGLAAGSNDGTVDNLHRIAQGKGRVLCWILTGVSNHMTRAIHVKRTWGSRCDILLFMSSQQDDRLGTIALPGMEEGHDKLWPKAVAAFKYVWEHHRHDAEWFLKADDDTWVFTNNLRSFLASYDPNEPHYFGFRADPENGVGLKYNHGGTGYVVSKETLRMFIQDSLPYPEKCYTGIRPLYDGDEDKEFAACLQSIGILPENTMDEHGRARFVPINVAGVMRQTWKKGDEWKRRLFWTSNYSDQPISFHKVRPEYMYVLEYVTSYLKLDAK